MKKDILNEIEYLELTMDGVISKAESQIDFALMNLSNEAKQRFEYLEDGIAYYERGFNSKWNQELEPVDTATQDLSVITEPSQTFDVPIVFEE